MGLLKERMEADLRLRNLRPSTQARYVRCVRELAKHYGRSPAKLNESEVRSFVIHLQDKRGLKPTSLRPYIAALRFFYKVTLGRPELVCHLHCPRVPRKVPEVLSGSEVQALFAAVRSVKYRAVLMTTYGAGLRISEVCRLRVQDIDSRRMLIHGSVKSFVYGAALSRCGHSVFEMDGKLDHHLPPSVVSSAPGFLCFTNGQVQELHGRLRRWEMAPGLKDLSQLSV